VILRVTYCFCIFGVALGTFLSLIDQGVLNSKFH